MQWISKSKILIIGLGLMGGSYAKRLRRLGYSVSAIDRDEKSIEYALKNGIIDCGSTTPDKELISSADAAIFALYPTALCEWADRYGKYFKPGTLITDVTGIKECVVYDVQKNLPEGVEFIAAHPMAGREVSGIKNADDGIFRDANYIVVPTDKNTEQGIEWCKSLGNLLGFAKVSVLTPEKHDEMISFVSQLTHCIAVTLMNCNDDRNIVDYTGDSFRDLTRIARINDKMWSELFLLNKEPLLKQMDIFAEQFSQLRECLANEDGDGIRQKMKISSERRSWFDKENIK